MVQYHPQETLVAQASPQSSFIPVRSQPSEEGLARIQASRLSRTHKHVFFLIDGQRSIQELVRLLKRDEQGVYSLVLDLERIGLIKLTRANSPASILFP